MVNFIWSIISSVVSVVLTGGVAAIYRALHNRFDSIDSHLRSQDLRIARIEGKLDR